MASEEEDSFIRVPEEQAGDYIAVSTRSMARVIST